MVLLFPVCTVIPGYVSQCGTVSFHAVHWKVLSPILQKTLPKSAVPFASFQWEEDGSYPPEQEGRGGSNPYFVNFYSQYSNWCWWIHYIVTTADSSQGGNDCIVYFSVGSGHHMRTWPHLLKVFYASSSKGKPLIWWAEKPSDANATVHTV